MAFPVRMCHLAFLQICSWEKHLRRAENSRVHETKAHVVKAHVIKAHEVCWQVDPCAGQDVQTWAPLVGTYVGDHRIENVNELGVVGGKVHLDGANGSFLNVLFLNYSQWCWNASVDFWGTSERVAYERVKYVRVRNE